ELSQQAGIDMPEVGIFPAQQANAFATGWNRNKALVAVSAGLLQRFDRDEAKAVLAHEIGHVANGDMVTLALLQGVVNTFVMFFARIIGHTVDRVVFKNERGHGFAFYIVTFIAEIILAILASMIVLKFSRYREFRADAAGANLAGRSAMISALMRFQPVAKALACCAGKMPTSGMSIPACWESSRTVWTSHCSSAEWGCSISWVPVPILARVLERSREIKDPKNPNTAQNTSKLPISRSIPLAAR
ncbi:MAG: protease HtpX, partial [Exilibacterium sp.]